MLGIAVSGSLCFKVAGYFAHDRRLRLTVVPLVLQYRYHDVRNTNEIARHSYLTRGMPTSDVVLIAVGILINNRRPLLLETRPAVSWN